MNSVSALSVKMKGLEQVSFYLFRVVEAYFLHIEATHLAQT